MEDSGGNLSHLTGGLWAGRGPRKTGTGAEGVKPCWVGLSTNKSRQCTVSLSMGGFEVLNAVRDLQSIDDCKTVFYFLGGESIFNPILTRVGAHYHLHAFAYKHVHANKCK